MVGSNIEYKSQQIKQYYQANRTQWSQFYPSEQWVFNRIMSEKANNLGSVLDVGCACGGLRNALLEKAALLSYTGVDINGEAIEWANRDLTQIIPTRLIAGDILKLAFEQQYDVVVSLSCADFNIETSDIIKACWNTVKPGGYFVISLRLTPLEGINDIRQSYQYINFSGNEANPEIANYVVFNFKEALGLFSNLQPSPALVAAYGYWGEPSSMAVTKYDKLVFTVFYIKKAEKESGPSIASEMFLPLDIYR